MIELKISAYLKSSQETWHQLVDLQQTDILANTRSRPRSELQHTGVHLLQLFLTCFKPPLGAIMVNIITIDFAPSMHDPCTTGNDGASWYMSATDFNTLRGRYTLEW